MDKENAMGKTPLKGFWFPLELHQLFRNERLESMVTSLTDAMKVLENRRSSPIRPLQSVLHQPSTLVVMHQDEYDH